MTAIAAITDIEAITVTARSDAAAASSFESCDGAARALAPTVLRMGVSR